MEFNVVCWNEWRVTNKLLYSGGMWLKSRPRLNILSFKQNCVYQRIFSLVTRHRFTKIQNTEQTLSLKHRLANTRSYMKRFHLKYKAAIDF